MALNFPNSPTNGQLYTDTMSGNSWTWDSANTCWKSTSTYIQTITVASSAPGTPAVGQLWWNQDYGRLLVYYSDGTSSQWVDASPSDYTSGLAYNQANAAFGVANNAVANSSSIVFAGTSANSTLLNGIAATSYMVLKSRDASYNANTTVTGTAAYLKWLDGGGSPRGLPGNTSSSYGSTGNAASTPGLLLEYDALYNAGEAGQYKLQMYHSSSAGDPLWYRTQSAGIWNSWNSFVQANYLGNVGIGLIPTSRNNTTLQIKDGIGFPATQVSSSDANTLDDYEEGTWTPTASPSSGTITSYTASGTYTKIGRVVQVNFLITITNAGTAAGAYLQYAGLPFTVSNSTKPVGVCRENSVNGYLHEVLADQSLTTGNITRYDNGGSIVNGGNFHCSLMYYT